MKTVEKFCDLCQRTTTQCVDCGWCKVCKSQVRDCSIVLHDSRA